MIRALALLCAVLLPVNAAAGTLRQISFLPQWSPQAQFAGYYVALDQGIYRRHGLEVAILQGGPARSGLDFLEKGKADFTTAWLSTAIQRRAQGMRLVHIAQIIQKSALMLVAKRSSGIRLPRDMNGRKVGVWPDDFQIQPRAFFRKNHVEARLVSQSVSVNLFLRGGVDVASAMWYNEYHSLLLAGLDPEELTPFFFHEYGLNFPEDGIYVLEGRSQRGPGLSCAFAQASLEGWRWAFSQPEEALDIVMKFMIRAKVPANRVHQRWMLQRMKDLVTPEGSRGPGGVLLPSDYERVGRELREAGLITEVPSLGSFSLPCAPDVSR